MEEPGTTDQAWGLATGADADRAHRSISASSGELGEHEIDRVSSLVVAVGPLNAILSDQQD